MLTKSKFYLISMNMPVRINNIARMYSIIFFVFKSFTKILNELPKIAQSDIEGKQTIGAVNARNIVALKKLSSVGKKPETPAIATAQAFGFIN